MDISPWKEATKPVGLKLKGDVFCFFFRRWIIQGSSNGNPFYVADQTSIQRHSNVEGAFGVGIMK